MTEAGVILWIGVAVGLIGLGATAANGTALILRRLRQGAATAKRWTDGQLARVFPSRRKEVSVQAASATVTAQGSPVLLGFGTMVPPKDAPVEQQLEAIRSNAESLQRRVEYLEQQSQSRHSALVSGLGEIREGLTAVTGRLNEEATNSALTDARGLWPLAFGFVMVAVPNQLASASLFGAFIAAAAIAVTGWTVQTVGPGVLRTSRH